MTSYLFIFNCNADRIIPDTEYEVTSSPLSKMMHIVHDASIKKR